MPCLGKGSAAACFPSSPGFQNFRYQVLLPREPKRGQKAHFWFALPNTPVTRWALLERDLLLSVVLLLKGELGNASGLVRVWPWRISPYWGTLEGSPQKCFTRDLQVPPPGPSQRRLVGDHSGHSPVVSRGLVAQPCHGLSCVVPESPRLSSWNSEGFL